MTSNCALLIDTLDREWRDTAQRLDQWIDLDPIERRELIAEWPLLADWWERTAMLRNERRLSASQEHVLNDIREIMRSHLVQLESIIGRENVSLLGI